LDEIAYDELLEMAGAGSKVVQSRAVEFAKKFGVQFEVRSSFNRNVGTIAKAETASMEDVVIRGISLDRHHAKLTIAGHPDEVASTSSWCPPPRSRSQSSSTKRMRSARPS